MFIWHVYSADGVRSVFLSWPLLTGSPGDTFCSTRFLGYEMPGCFSLGCHGNRFTGCPLVVFLPFTAECCVHTSQPRNWVWQSAGFTFDSQLSAPEIDSGGPTADLLTPPMPPYVTAIINISIITMLSDLWSCEKCLSQLKTSRESSAELFIPFEFQLIVNPLSHEPAATMWVCCDEAYSAFDRRCKSVIDTPELTHKALKCPFCVSVGGL